MSKIKLTNDVKVHSESLQIAIDPTNQLFYVSSPTGGTSSAVVVTEDCFVYGSGSSFFRAADDDTSRDFGDAYTLLRKGDRAYAKATYNDNKRIVRGYGLK